MFSSYLTARTNLFIIFMLLLILSNDIELNPGPDVGEISFFHLTCLNSRSVRNTITNIECLAHEYQLISITETQIIT